MSNRADSYPSEVLCPLVDRVIQAYECIETQDGVAGMLREDSIPPEYKVKPHWREICMQCKYFETD